MRWEKTGERDLAFSSWHRLTCPDGWGMIDADFVAYCKDCEQPLFLIEHARDVGQSYKTFRVTKQLARMAGIPAFLILYRLGEDGFIVSFRFQQVWPNVDSKLGYECQPEHLRDLFAIERLVHSEQCDRSAVRF